MYRLPSKFLSAHMAAPHRALLWILSLAICIPLPANAQTLEEIYKFRAAFRQIKTSADVETARSQFEDARKLLENFPSWRLGAHLTLAEWYKSKNEFESSSLVLDEVEQQFLPEHILYYEQDFRIFDLIDYANACLSRERRRQDDAASLRWMCILRELKAKSPEEPVGPQTSSLSIAKFLIQRGLSSEAVWVLQNALRRFEITPDIYKNPTPSSFHRSSNALQCSRLRLELAKTFIAWKKYEAAKAELDVISDFLASEFREKQLAYTLQVELLQFDIAHQGKSPQERIRLVKECIERLSGKHLEGNPQAFSEAKLRLAEAYTADMQWEQVISICEEATANTSLTVPIQERFEFLVAQANLQLGQTSVALSKLKDLLEVSENPSFRERLYSLLANYYTEQGDYEAAFKLRQEDYLSMANYPKYAASIRLALWEAETEINYVRSRIAAQKLEEESEAKVEVFAASASRLEAEKSERQTSLSYVTLAVVLIGAMGLFAVLQRLTFERRQRESERLANRRLTEVVEQTSKKLQQEFEAKERLEKSLERKRRDEAIGQLTGCVAHDFNNLLQVIFSANEVLSRRDDLSETEMKLLDASSTSASAGANVVRQLMAFAKKQNLTPEPLLLSTFLQDVSSLLLAAIDRQCDLKIIDNAPGMVVMLDSSQLTTALINLLSNAADAMPDGGEIKLIASSITVMEQQDCGWPDVAEGEYLTISLSDQGEGMDEGQIAKAFEPFFSTKNPSRGVGLGLSSVYGFVKQSGGDIRIQTRPEGGTLVEMLFSRSYETPIAQHIYSMPSDVENCRVLLVEDDEQVGATLEHLMQSLGYKTLLVTNAIDAIAMLKGFYEFDFVITDYQLPGEMSGLDLAGWVSGNLKGVGVVLVSGGLAILEQDTHTILPKPFKQEQLFQAIYTERMRIEEGETQFGSIQSNLADTKH